MSQSFLCRRLQPFAMPVFDEIRRLAVAHGAIDLGPGEPDFDGPEFVKEAAVRAILDGFNQYSPSSGAPRLTKAIAEHQSRFYGLSYDPESEVTVFAGASEALFSTFQALCEPGDEVILIEPFFDVYQPALTMAGGVARAAGLLEPGFVLVPERIERLISSRTRAILLNDPHNPTGRVFSAKERAGVAALCERHDLLAISDQVYEHLTFTEGFAPLATLPGMRNRTITIGSLSKTFALTGWKIGYACAPERISAALRTVHKFVTLCSSTPLQHAMAEALRAGEDFYQGLRESYRERRDMFCQGLRELGFGVVPPAGSCFALADVRPFGYRSGMDFCRQLPELAGVAARPLDPFYLRAGEDHTFVRFAFCRRIDTLSEALRRLQKARSTGRLTPTSALASRSTLDTARPTTSECEES